jgi:hypothetical protein
MKFKNIKRAREHLYAALAQVIDKDDKIIVNHMRAAYELLDAIDDPLLERGGEEDNNGTAQKTD